MNIKQRGRINDKEASILTKIQLVQLVTSSSVIYRNLTICQRFLYAHKITNDLINSDEKMSNFQLTKCMCQLFSFGK